MWLVQWTSKLCPFHISKHILGDRYTLNQSPFGYEHTVNTEMSIINAKKFIIYILDVFLSSNSTDSHCVHFCDVFFEQLSHL